MVRADGNCGYPHSSVIRAKMFVGWRCFFFFSFMLHLFPHPNISCCVEPTVKIAAITLPELESVKLKQEGSMKLSLGTDPLLESGSDKRTLCVL